MHVAQEDAEGEEEEDTAEGGADEDGDEDEDEQLSALVCILPDLSSVTDGNLCRLVLEKEMRSL